MCRLAESNIIQNLTEKTEFPERELLRLFLTSASTFVPSSSSRFSTPLLLVLLFLCRGPNESKQFSVVVVVVVVVFVSVLVREQGFMNLSEFFTPPSLERGGIEHRSSPLKKMPPRAKEGGGGGGLVVYDSEPMMQQLVRNNHAPQLLAAVQEFKLLESSRERGGGGGGGTRRRAAEENVSSRTSSSSSPPSAAADVTLFVGRNRASYTLCAESLRQSTYFSSLLEKRSTTQEPIVVDCEESVFQNLLLILRYRSFEALPRMSDSELFRLRRELEIHGIELPENMPRKESSSSSSPSSSSAGGSGNLSPSSLSAASRCNPMQQQQQQQLARVLHQQQHSSVSELPDFPEELKDSSKIVLVARIDDDERGRCTCTPKTQQQQHSGYWALSFHYRHAFCTGCGKSASAMLSPRFVAEIYMAAAMYYSGENVTNKQKWSVGCDSTCSLKLLNARPCCLCPCSSLNTNSKTSSSSSSNSSSSVWAVSTYHSHAFCTRCGESANDQTLVCILLTLRYGGISKSTTRLRRLEHSNGSSGSENVITASSDVVTPLPKLLSASNSKTLTTTTEIPRHTRSNKSL